MLQDVFAAMNKVGEEPAQESATQSTEQPTNTVQVLDIVNGRTVTVEAEKAPFVSAAEEAVPSPEMKKSILIELVDHNQRGRKADEQTWRIRRAHVLSSIFRNALEELNAKEPIESLVSLAVAFDSTMYHSALVTYGDQDLSKLYSFMEFIAKNMIPEVIVNSFWYFYQTELMHVIKPGGGEIGLRHLVMHQTEANHQQPPFIVEMRMNFQVSELYEVNYIDMSKPVAANTPKPTEEPAPEPAAMPTAEPAAAPEGGPSVNYDQVQAKLAAAAAQEVHLQQAAAAVTAAQEPAATAAE